VAEAGSPRQKTGGGAPFRADQEGLAGVPLVSPAAPDEVLFSAVSFGLKPVQERLRNYYQNSAPASGDHGGRVGSGRRQAGTAHQHKARGVITHRLTAGHPHAATWRPRPCSRTTRPAKPAAPRWKRPR